MAYLIYNGRNKFDRNKCMKPEEGKMKGKPQSNHPTKLTIEYKF